jgi:hypothetical protein
VRFFERSTTAFSANLRDREAAAKHLAAGTFPVTGPSGKIELDDDFLNKCVIVVGMVNSEMAESHRGRTSRGIICPVSRLANIFL